MTDDGYAAHAHGNHSNVFLFLGVICTNPTCVHLSHDFTATSSSSEKFESHSFFRPPLPAEL